MAGVTVAYSPTKSNRLILAKIRPLPMLDGIGFAPLPKGQADRLELITKMSPESRRNTLFLWGDGKHHDESYYFTARPETKGVKRLKVNLDPHSDEYTCLSSGDGIDFKTMKPKRGNLELMSFANHMSCTEANGVEIFTTERLTTGSIMGMFFREVADLIIQGITKRGMMRYIRAASDRISSFDGEVDATLDLDLVRGIPVLEQFIQTHDSINAARLLAVLESVMPILFQFDAGGVIEDIPNFKLIEDIPLNKSPKESDVLTVISASKDPVLAQENQDIIDAVGSHTAMFLANVIRIFSQSRQ